ncbi:ricin-type beta-trefoil lectin domain protein [Streptomyces sp. NPDC096046]|uniref:ricin-type beta-trefoil lectin domain protein n=1 Tax=Streptomyces sp. NPDC096046 TaxID=3155542 RepID=UPI00332E117C
MDHAYVKGFSAAALAGALTIGSLVASPAQASDDNRIRFKFRDSRSVCLTAYERSNDPLVMERCDGDNARGNWRKIIYSGGGLVFLLQNVASGECLDAESGLEAKAYTSPCDITDRGQHWYYFCDSGSIMAAAWNTVLTGWNDNKVTTRSGSNALVGKQRWDRMPAVC